MSSTSPIPQPPVVSSSSEPERPQADPLPTKPGEIGYTEGVHSSTDSSEEDDVALPARHPADRDPSPFNEPIVSAPSARLSEARTFGGLQLSTILVFVLQLLLLGGTITGWIFATKLLKNVSASGQRLPGGQASGIFAHVFFVIAVIGELVFLERRLFRLRGERYSYLHPGEVLPRHRTIPITSHPGIAFAPWNRPPLPTYAAALAQSGAGTGDVEDHIIAAPPPPAYGNTRGSTLLLAGYLRESLRVQRTLSASSQATPTPSERPVSYVSRDEQWEDIQNADRARRLEETLNQLEAPHRPASRS